MVTPICEKPLCGIICFFFPPFATACVLPPLITAPQMKGVLFDSVLIIQLQSNNSTLQEYKGGGGSVASPNFKPPWI